MPRLAIIGAGSLRHSPAVIASLANYYGERPLDIRLYDPIAERLELFELLAQHCLGEGVTGHTVTAHSEHRESLEDAEHVIVQLDAESASAFLKPKLCDSPIEEALEVMLDALSPEADVLSLLGHAACLPLERYQALDWPAPPDETYRRAMPHQVLRWIRKEESIASYLLQFERSPVKLWLEDPSSLPMISRRS